MSQLLSEDFFAAPTVEVARALVGVTLAHGGCAGRIVETEAYTDDDASHFVTRRHAAAIMGTTHGRIYIYSIYGIHHCLNVTADGHGPGAVLIRALEPLEGLDRMRGRRGRDQVRDLCSGPAKLFVALGLDPAVNGRPVSEVLTLETPTGGRRPEVLAGPRVGISRATDLPWRFRAAGSPFTS